MALINVEMADRGPVGTAGVVASGGAPGGGASRFPRSCAASPSSASVVIDGSGVAALSVDLGCPGAFGCAGGGVVGDGGDGGGCADGAGVSVVVVELLFQS